MSNSIAPGSSADVNVKVTALTTNPNVPVTYKTIILKKNLVNGVNTLTQEMMSAENTKYVIKYDYTLGEDITVPKNCILAFDGGSLKNGTLIGNNTRINEDSNYNIFNDCVIKNFEISKCDIRWVGGIGDYDDSTHSGTDNAVYFQRALDNILKYNFGIPIDIVGRYMISSTVNVNYNLYLQGTHNVTRFSKNRDSSLGTKNKRYSNSEIIVNCGDELIPAFKLIGEENVETTTCDLYISHIKITGVDRSKDIAIKSTASGAPTRPAIIEFCEANNLLYFLELYCKGSSIFGNLTIKDCFIYENGKAIYSHSEDNSYFGICNLAIRDNVIEHNGDRAIHIEELYGPIIIDNNILEGQDNPIYIKPHVIFSTNRQEDYITITNNYFERQADNDTKIYIDASNLVGTTPQQLYGANVIILNNYSIFGLKVYLKWVRIVAIDRIDSPSLPSISTKYSIFENCIFEKGCNTRELYIEQLEGCNLFEEYPERCYNIASDKIATIGDEPVSFAKYRGKNNAIISNYSSEVSISNIDSTIVLIGRALSRREDERFFIRVRNQYNGGSGFGNGFDHVMYPKQRKPYYFVLKTKKEDSSVTSAPFRMRASVSNGAENSMDTSNLVYYEIADGKGPILSYPLVVTEPDSMFRQADEWIGGDGYINYARRKGTTKQRPTGQTEQNPGGILRPTYENGFRYYDTDLKKYIHVGSINNNGEVNWFEEDGAVAGVKRNGTFAQKPIDWEIYIGFKYFCTDRQTPEGTIDGIEIIHKGDNVWVDALGRVVS